MPESSDEDLAEKARAQLRQQKAEAKFQTWLRTLRDNAYVELRGFAKDQ